MAVVQLSGAWLRSGNKCYVVKDGMLLIPNLMLAHELPNCIRDHLHAGGYLWKQLHSHIRPPLR